MPIKEIIIGLGIFLLIRAIALAVMLLIAYLTIKFSFFLMDKYFARKNKKNASK